MNSRPFFSLIIPTYNSAILLDETLLSIRSGVAADVEVIVIDDGSTDTTPAVLKKWKELLPSLRVVRQENQGLSASRNLGLNYAKGLYGVFLDADDLLDLDILLTYLRETVKNRTNSDLLLFDTIPFSEGKGSDLLDYYSNYYRRRENLSNYRDQSLFEQLVVSRGLRVSACLYAWRTDFVSENRIFFRDNVIMEDNAFSFKCFSQAKSAEYWPVAIHRRRVSKNSLSNSSSLWAISRGYYYAFADSLVFLLRQGKFRRWQRIFVMRLMFSVMKHFWRALEISFRASLS